MFLKIWLAVAAQIRAIESAIYQAMSGSGTMAVTTGVVMLIFWTYVAWKIYELWIAQADDTFTRKLWYIFNNYRRMMIVYLLVISAPVLVGSLGSVARGFAKQGRAKVEAPIPAVFTQVDNVLKQSTGMMQGVGTMLAAHAGGQDVAEMTTLQWAGVTAGAIVSKQSASKGVFVPGAGNVIGAMQASYDAGGAKYAENYDRARSGLDRAVDGARDLGKLGRDVMKTQIQMADARGDKRFAQQLRDYQVQVQSRNLTALASATGMANSSLSPEQMRRAEANALFMVIQEEWMEEAKAASFPDASGKPPAGTAGGLRWKNFEAAGGWAKPEAVAALQSQIQAEVNSQMAARDQAKGWQKDIPRFGWEIIGVIGMLICAVGIIAAGINIFKAAYGALLYCVGFVATVVFAVSIATPLSSAFMLCFISDKTEPYGRNFVNFMLGGVFASMGMMLMAGAVSKLFLLTAQSILAEGAYRLSMVMIYTTSIGEFLLACLTTAGAMMIAGMAFTFIADFIKKGAAVGAGIFSGHFPA